MRTTTISRIRRAMLASAAAAALVVPAVRAQEDKGAPDAAPTAPPQRPEGQMQNPAAQREETQSYTIQKGDTLWDLSQKFLNNPWYWPKIWSLNPTIENPHWIYPGQKLKVMPGQGGAPAQVEAQAGSPAGADGQPAPDGAAQPPQEGADSTQASADADPLAPVPGGPDVSVMAKGDELDAATRSVTSAGRLSFTPPAALTVRAGGLVTPEELAQAGTIDSSFEEKEMLATYDTAYVHFKQDGLTRVGDKVLIFRPDGTITHPVTHTKIADRAKTVAEAKVVAMNGRTATVSITRTWEEIARGDLVRPWSEQNKRVAARPNGKSMTGVIIGAVNDGLSTYGEANEVFIDKGKADGVEEGNTFVIVRKGDGLSATGAGLTGYTAGTAGDKGAKQDNPDESLGMLLVVDVKDKVSTAVVIRSIRELEAGERVEMRAQAGSGGY